MTSKDLKKLSRKELIELFLAQAKEFESTKAKLISELDQTTSLLTHELELTKRELELSDQIIAQLREERKMFESDPIFVQVGNPSDDEELRKLREAAHERQTKDAAQEPEQGQSDTDSQDADGETGDTSEKEHRENKWEQDLPQTHLMSTGIRDSRQ